MMGMFRAPLAGPDPVCAPGLALAFHDGSVHIVHRLSLQTMAVFYSSAAPRSVDEPAVKRPRATGPAVHFKAMQLSWTSLALVGIDNHGKVNRAMPVGRHGGGGLRRGPRVRKPGVPPPSLPFGGRSLTRSLRCLCLRWVHCAQ